LIAAWAVKRALKKTSTEKGVQTKYETTSEMDWRFDDVAVRNCAQRDDGFCSTAAPVA
jgi:hypothetical protein